MSEENEVIQSFRVDPDLREAFKRVCASKDQTVSQVLRAFMRDFVRKNGQMDMFRDK